MKYEKFNYIYPPRPVTAIPFGSDSFEKMKTKKTWIAQLKLDGQRNCIYLPPGDEVQLYNRHHGGHKNYKLPDEIAAEIRQVLPVERDKWSVFDGELMYRGVENTALGNIRHTFYLWDILVLNGDHMLGSLYRDRYQKLYDMLGAADKPRDEHAIQISPHIWMAINLLPEEWDAKWPLTATKWVEGFVLKNLSGRLTPGYKEENNSEWLIRCRKETGRSRF